MEAAWSSLLSLTSPGLLLPLLTTCSSNTQACFMNLYFSPPLLGSSSPFHQECSEKEHNQCPYSKVTPIVHSFSYRPPWDLIFNEAKA